MNRQERVNYYYSYSSSRGLDSIYSSTTIGHIERTRVLETHDMLFFQLTALKAGYSNSETVQKMITAFLSQLLDQHKQTSPPLELIPSKEKRR